MYVVLHFPVMCLYKRHPLFDTLLSAFPLYVCACITCVAAFLFLEETLYTKKNKRRKNSGDSSNSSREEGSVEISLTGDRVDSAGSMQSTDSGIELLPSDKIDSDTEMIDLSNNDDDPSPPDGIMMAESDIDTDSDFERVNSDTELLVTERREARKYQNYKSSGLRNCFTKFRKHCVPECIFTECAPSQCYGSARHSVIDSYESIFACVRCVKICSTRFCCCCRRNKWTPPGETGSGGGKSGGDGRDKVRIVRRSIVDMLRLVVDRRVFLSTLLYGLVAFIVIISNEVIMTSAGNFF